jgi:PAS domain S-box-containing protein
MKSKSTDHNESNRGVRRQLLAEQGLERTPVPCFSLDAQGRILSLNGAGAELLGGEPGRLAGRPLHSLVVDDARATLRNHLSEAFCVDHACCEIPISRREGGVRWIQLLSWAGQGEDEEMVCMCSATDITRHKEAEERLEKEREQVADRLRQVHKMEAIVAMAEGIAYDFNNLLQALYGNVQLLLSRKMDEGPDIKPLREMERITKRAADNVRHLLTCSRKMKDRQQLVDINGVVRRALEQLRPGTSGKVTVSTELRPDLPELCADPHQMEQILVNLVKNSFDSIIGAGAITISTGIVQAEDLPDRRRTDSRKELYILITVKDTGKGMDSETLKRIYEPFFTTKEKGGGTGTGLGLSAVHGIIKSYDGLIRCDSAPGRGTTFSIYLPVERSCTHPEPGPGETTLECIATAPNKTILVVDDEGIIREITSEILRQSGYRVLTAASGEEGLRMYRENEGVNLVLLDLGMPGMGGERCLEELLKLDKGARVIITTGYARHRLCQAKQWRIAGFLAKPYEYKTLLNAVRAGLEGGSPSS